MEHRHIVITGGASGLGLGCAARFRRLGAHLTLLDRDAAAAQRALATLLPLGPAHATLAAETVDLAEPDSIAAVVARLHARGAAIDVLVNNAGIYPPSQRRLSGEGQELSFAIGHLGHFRLTHGLWPLLEAAPAARVISVSSLVQRYAQLALDDLTLARHYEPFLAYRQTKLACLLFTIELQRRLGAAGHRITSYATHPGVCRTQLGQHRARAANDTLWQRFATAALSFGQRYVGQSPERGANATVAAATRDDFAPGSFIGPKWLLESCGPVGVARPGVAAADAALGQALWQRSETITGVRWAI